MYFKVYIISNCVSAHRTQQIKTHRVLIEELNYKGAVPDNILYSAPSHSTFPPPRPPSPTLPPLPLLRQMPSLAPPRNTPPTSARSTPGTGSTNVARPNPRSSPHPMSSPRSLPSPRSVHYTSPNPLSLSSPRSDSSEPPPLMAKQMTRNSESRDRELLKYWCLFMYQFMKILIDILIDVF